MRAARHKVWFGLQSTGSSPCSLKGLVASLYAVQKKQGFFRPLLSASSVLGCDNTQSSSQHSPAASHKLTLVLVLTAMACKVGLHHRLEQALVG